MRSGHSKPSRTCPKVESLSWDGHRWSFRTIQNALEGHLLQIGMGYLLQPSFHQAYMYDSQGYIASEQFFQIYQISTPQAFLYHEYLYVIFKVATKTTQLPTLIKYHDSQDGIAAWVEILADYAHDG